MIFTRTTYTFSSLRVGQKLRRKSEGLAYEKRRKSISLAYHTPKNRPPGVRTPNSKSFTETLASMHPPGLPSRTILDRTYFAQRFSFLVTGNFFLFIFGRAVDNAGLTASFRAHVNIVYLLTYLLTNSQCDTVTVRVSPLAALSTRQLIGRRCCIAIFKACMHWASQS